MGACLPRCHVRAGITPAAFARLAGIAFGLSSMLFVASASAQDAPPTPDLATMSVIGADLTPEEHDQAYAFCLDTLAQAPLIKTEPVRTCACFPAKWAALTNRLQRLALPILHAPRSSEAKRVLAEIGRLQGGIHEARLQELADAYQAAAKQAIRACL